MSLKKTKQLFSCRREDKGRINLIKTLQHIYCSYTKYFSIGAEFMEMHKHLRDDWTKEREWSFSNLSLHVSLATTVYF